MEFEIRITDPKDFEELKRYATYSSDITKVMVFDSSAFNKGVTLLDKYFKISEKSPVNQNDLKFIIDIDTHKKIFLIAPDSYISFCNGTKPKGSKIGFVRMNNAREIYILLKYGLLQPSNNFKEWFSPLDLNCNLIDLRTFTSRKEFRGNKAWTFEKYFKSEIESGRIKTDLDKITTKSTDIFNAPKTIIPEYHEIRGTVTDINYKMRKAQINSYSEGIIQVEMHGWAPFAITWNVGSEIRLMVKKIYGDDGKYKRIIDPIILPEDIKITNYDEFYSNFVFLSNRKFPTELLNKLWYEYKIRTELM